MPEKTEDACYVITQHCSDVEEVFSTCQCGNMLTKITDLDFTHMCIFQNDA